MVTEDTPELRSAHVIVVGNEKGGSGKSTLSIHIIVALLKAGFQVASIDLDTRQRTLTRFVDNRRSWSQQHGRAIELPFHHALARGETESVAENEEAEFGSFAAAITAIEHAYEFLVIDTPASDSYLMRLAHSLADTLVSPINDSFIDVDVFTRIHHDRGRRGEMGQYGALVQDARKQRRLADSGLIDWVVVRNRIASLQSNNARQITLAVETLARDFRFRVADGLHDRVIFKELFPIGLTALDPIEEGLRNGLSPSQATAREEVDRLLKTLQLPERIEGLPHIAARHVWYERLSAIYADMDAA